MPSSQNQLSLHHDQEESHTHIYSRRKPDGNQNNPNVDSRFRSKQGGYPHQPENLVVELTLKILQRAYFYRICYPESYKFSTEATRWGCTHEKMACEAYMKIMEERGTDFKAKDWIFDTKGLSIHRCFSNWNNRVVMLSSWVLRHQMPFLYT